MNGNGALLFSARQPPNHKPRSAKSQPPAVADRTSPQTPAKQRKQSLTANLTFMHLSAPLLQLGFPCA